VIRSRPDRWFDRFRRTGDARLLARVFDAVAPELWRVAAHLCRDRHLAEDAVQATFLSAIEAPQDWDTARPLLPWLLGMLANRVREQRRRAARTPDAARLERAGERDPVAVAADREVAATLQQALARLDEPYRSTLEQHLVHGLAAHEIAREQDLPAGTVRMRLHRGLDQLRSKLPPGLVAAGGAALALQTGALAAMRTRVLGEVPGGAAVAAGSGHVGSFVIGVLVMNKMLCAVLGSAVAVLLAWWAWPDAATAGAATPLPPTTTAVAEPVAAAASPPVAAAPAPLPAARTAAPEPTAAAQQGLLRVQLHSAGDGAPVDGAWLRVRGGLQRDPGPAAGNQTTSTATDDDRTLRSTTKADGAAMFSLPVGFAAVTVDDTELRSSAEVRAGGVTELKLEVPLTFTAELRVVDDAGRPVPDARLVGSTSRDSFGLAAREFGRTDRDGRCRVDAVDRVIRLRARHEGFAASAATELRPNRTRATLHLGSAPAVVIGTVLDATARPLANCAVGVQSLPRSRGDAAPILVWTDTSGRFICTGVPAGRCLVVAAHRLDDGSSRLAQQEATAAAGTETSVEVRFGAGAALDVQLSAADGKSLTGAYVTLQLQHPDLDDEFQRLGNAFVELDDRGAGTVRDLLPGRYLLQVVHEGLLERNLELAAGAHERFVHVFGAGPGLEVRVVDLAGKPLAGWLVTWIGGAVGRSENTDADGRVRFRDLPEPNGRITVQPDASTPPLAQREVASDTSVTVAIDLAQQGQAELRGIVVPPAGTKLAGLRAMVVQRGADPTVPMRPQTIPIDADTGAFAATQLAAGNYALMVDAGRGDAQPLLFRDSIVIPVRGIVDLGRLVLGSGQLELRATLADGGAVEDAAVAMRVAASDPFATPPGKDPLSMRLPAGDYGVLVWGPTIAPIVTSANVQVDVDTPLTVTAERAAPVTLRFTDAGTGVDFGMLTIRSNGGESLKLVLQVQGPLVRGFAVGRHELEFDDLRGKRFVAAFTVGADLATQDVMLLPKQ
jgi:RNA polymerase sigma factor (sigma-70 family)